MCLATLRFARISKMKVDCQAMRQALAAQLIFKEQTTYQ
jgi:hypothetical protein